MFWRKSRTIRDLSAVVNALEDDLAAERKITDSLQKALALTADPKNYSAERVDDLIRKARMDADAPVVQAPDGEYIAPASYDWERLAHDIYDTYGDQGGASGEW